ncbi:MAG: helix-turn-helix domain-containing protein [Lachnospiraceae bacterium]|nr:helix-turn-helix domain-containing protein [Lachnospiraceae bacterium]
MELGKKIRQLRFKAGLTQEMLAEKLGIGPQSVSKWETGVAMPDISSLPLIAEIFGVSIDELFDLTAEQRLNRIENRMDIEEELPQDVFRDYEDYLKAQIENGEFRERAVSLAAYLYWHRMNSCAEKVKRYAKDSIRTAPGKKECQWMLAQAEHHAVWDWNISNHKNAIEFYREVVDENPEERLPYLYLIDNLLADRRTDEAEQCIEKLAALPDPDLIMIEVYRAFVRLLKFDEKGADGIMEDLLKAHPDDSAVLFETAQYHAKKGDYEKAAGLYEKSFDLDPRRPRFQDALYAVADICEIRKDYQKAAKVYDRIIDLLEREWDMTEETVVQDAKKERARLLSKA